MGQAGLQLPFRRKISTRQLNRSWETASGLGVRKELDATTPGCVTTRVSPAAAVLAVAFGSAPGRAASSSASVLSC